MSRVIDYGLARACSATAHNPPGARYGSDHDLIVFSVRALAGTLRVGFWNTRHRRRDRRVTALVAEAMDTHRLDALMLAEAAEYVDDLQRAGLRVVTTRRDKQPGQHLQVIVVRRHLPIREPGVERMTWRGFPLLGNRRRTTNPKWLPHVVLDGWLTIAAGHLPPSCRWVGGVIAGPPARVAAYVTHARRLVRWMRRQHGPVLVAADWNATPAARGRYSPHWIARQTGYTVVAPRRGTHHR